MTELKRIILPAISAKELARLDALQRAGDPDQNSDFDLIGPGHFADKLKREREAGMFSPETATIEQCEKVLPALFRAIVMHCTGDGMKGQAPVHAEFELGGDGDFYNIYLAYGDSRDESGRSHAGHNNHIGQVLGFIKAKYPDLVAAGLIQASPKEFMTMCNAVAQDLVAQHEPHLLKDLKSIVSGSGLQA